MKLDNKENFCEAMVEAMVITPFLLPVSNNNIVLLLLLLLLYYYYCSYYNCCYNYYYYSYDDNNNNNNYYCYYFTSLQLSGVPLGNIVCVSATSRSSET